MSAVLNKASLTEYMSTAERRRQNENAKQSKLGIFLKPADVSNQCFSLFA